MCICINLFVSTTSVIKFLIEVTKYVVLINTIIMLVSMLTENEPINVIIKFIKDIHRII